MSGLSTFFFFKPTQDFSCLQSQARLWGRGEGEEFRQLLSLLIKPEDCITDPQLFTVRFCDVLQYGEKRVFPITQEKWNAKIPGTSQFLFIDLEGICFYLSFLIFFNSTVSLQRDLGKNNIIHQEEVIKGSCDHF